MRRITLVVLLLFLFANHPVQADDSEASLNLPDLVSSSTLVADRFAWPSRIGAVVWTRRLEVSVVLVVPVGD